ncbi:MAG: hypothetical protein A4S09_05685 [Proteobacteria bacterium SG_bin7]|nr:MAG: hypothetical protein A4S09_05685 [Proteobacteria bacterium SG_bin7]
MSELEIRSIALFFFLAFLDDKKGTELSQSVVKKLKKLWAADKSVDHNISLISECFMAWKNTIEEKGQVIGSVIASETWKLPNNVGLEAWKKFLQLESQENVFPLIWTEILGRSEEIVGKALKVSQGTIRTRVSKGLIHLGSHCNTERANA